MKTRITTIILALLALATGAQAEDYGIEIAGVEVTSDNKDNLASIDGVTVGTNGRIVYYSSSKKLYLRNVTINKKGKIGIWNKSVNGLTIVFEECYVNGAIKGSWIESTNNSAIRLDKKTTFISKNKGYGVIASARQSGNTGDYADLYISTDADVIFENADISFEGNECYGIKGKSASTLTFIDSSVEIWGGTDDNPVPAIQTMGKLSIKGVSTVTLYGNDETQTVKGLSLCNLTDMAISSPSGASFSSSKQTFCYSNGQAIDEDIEFTTTAIPINSTNFPDEYFLDFVSEELDSDNNGYLTADERTATTIGVSNEKYIKKLNGIEYFADLVYLNCSYNQIGTLDLRQNTKLKTLICNNNQLTSLNLSGNTLLEVLRCYNNQLTSLNLSGNTLLEELRCNNNQLTSLNLNNNSKLTILLCNDNKLTSLNLSYNTLLSTLDCTNNQLTSLNLNYNTKLQSIKCYGNNLSTLTMGGSSYPNLNNVDLALDMMENQTLSFDTHQAIVNKLPTIPSGSSAYFGPGYYISKADVTKAQNKGWSVYSLGREAYKLSDIIPNTNFRDYVSSLSCCKFGWLIQTQANNITVMIVSSKSISDLTGINYFPNLRTLYCQNNTLTSLNVSALTSLQYLDCSGNKLTSLTLPKVQSLCDVLCYGNKLKGSYMTNTVNSLAYRDTWGNFYVATSASTEGNALNAQQLATLKSKKWSAYYLNSNNTWVPYEEGIVTSVEGVENEQQANDGTPQYNLQGQRVGNGYHGIVVRNGRKVLVK